MISKYKLWSKYICNKKIKFINFDDIHESNETIYCGYSFNFYLKTHLPNQFVDVMMKNHEQFTCCWCRCIEKAPVHLEYTKKFYLIKSAHPRRRRVCSNNNKFTKYFTTTSSTSPPAIYHSPI